MTIFAVHLIAYETAIRLKDTESLSFADIDEYEILPPLLSSAEKKVDLHEGTEDVEGIQHKMKMRLFVLTSRDKAF